MRQRYRSLFDIFVNMPDNLAGDLHRVAIQQRAPNRPRTSLSGCAIILDLLYLEVYNVFELTIWV